MRYVQELLGHKSSKTIRTNSDMKKPILFYPKVPYAGGRTTLELIKGLAQRHEIHLVSGIEKDPREICKRCCSMPYKREKRWKN